MARRRPPGKRSPKKAPLSKRGIGIVLLLLLVCGTLWGVVTIVFLGPEPARPPRTITPRRTKLPVNQPGSAARPATPAQPVTTTPRRPAMAIIIDDMGYQQHIGERLIDLDLALSFAFLPGAPFTTLLHQRAAARGRDILLHLPMEPEDSGWDPGPGALFVAMSPQRIRRVLNQDLAALPGAIGINNHMGSRFTRDPTAMTVVLEAIRAKGLFFIDSLTSPASIGYREARRLGVPTLRRDVFLDNVQDPAAITARLEELVRRARQTGAAVGIAHPKPTTLETLAAFRPPAEVDLVPIHRLIGRER